MKHLLMLAAALSLLCGAAQAGAAKLSPSSPYGLIAFEVEPGGRMAVANGGYTLNIARFSPDEHISTANSFGGWVPLTVSGADQDRAYHLVKAKPGSYVLMGLSIRNWWTCYNSDSVTFDIKAGEVTFVGRYDPRGNLAELSRALANGTLPRSVKSTARAYLFDTPRPTLASPADLPSWRSPFETWLKVEQPGVAGPVVEARPVATHFNTGSDAFGGQRICGGYYAEKEKPTAEAKTP